MASDTSSDNKTSDLKVDYINNNINKASIQQSKKPINATSETELYLHLLANPNKLKPDFVVDNSPVHEDSTSSDSIRMSNTSRRSEKSHSSKSSSSSSSSSSSKSSKSSKSSSSNKIPHIINGETSNSVNNLKTSDVQVPVKKELTQQEVRMRKIEMLRKLSEIKSKGYELSKDYDFNSSLEEMEYEYELLKSFADKKNGVKVYKNLLINGASIIEYLNDTYDPFDFHLDGWTEHMQIEVDNYDDILEELYEKYKGSGKSMPPELKLVMLIVGSAGAYHYSKSAANPHIKMGSSMMGKMLSKPKQESRFMSPQEMNIQKQQEMLKQRQMPQMAPIPQMPQSIPMGSPNMNAAKSPEIKIPSNVKDIMSRFKPATIPINPNPTELKPKTTNNDRIMSETTLDTSEINSEKKRGRKPKSTITINT
jgi:hypothetical protein